ncbi:MAG: IS630 family transposase [Sandaracinaceae bacterium]|nr:IS630 family transposase [Sandaracinaceae bacterium]
MTIKVSAKQKRALDAIVARPSESAGLVRRARVILLSAGGVAPSEIAVRLDLSREAVSRIRRRFLEEGIEGLAKRPKAGRKDHAVPAMTMERIVQLAMSPPPAGRSRWTTRLLAKEVGLTSGCVSDILRKNDLKPHLSRTYKVSRDPEFVSKVKDVVGLYLNPPEHAVVLSVDEKTSIQALERTQLPLPLRAGRAARHTHDYKRHGVLDLYAALEVATGKVTHRVSESHTAADFLAFMQKVVRQYPGRELHVILDNSSSHGTSEVREWLAANPRVRFHYTPTSASWLNQVEGFFGILGKQSLGTTSFNSKRALRKHIAAYMRTWNQNPTPFEWTKPARAIIRSHRRMIDRISTAVH